MPLRPDPEDFWQRGYAIAHDLVDDRLLAFAKAAIEASVRGGRMRHRAGVVPQGALNEYGSPIAERILRHCQGKIEAAVGRKLLPTYAFWRVYEQGAELARHSDRESCEVSATMTIHSEGEGQAWPIWFNDLQGNDVAAAPPPGSAVLYQGYRVQHWREPFAGQRQYQIFLHYVLEAGEFANHADDRMMRKRLYEHRD